MRSTLHRIGQAFVFSLLLCLLMIPGSSSRVTASSSQPEDTSFFDAGCTVIYGAEGDVALGGNNEDFANTETRIWFIPAEAGKYGRVLLGYDNYIWQGGMNDQGLFFDAMSIEEPHVVEQGNKPKYQGSLPARALETCADVDCVLDLFNDYHAYDIWAFQFLFGDASGNSVLIEPYQVQHGGRFLVGTNFLQSETSVNECRNCDRYWTARSMFENSDAITVDLIRDILDATHLEGDYPTQYSTVYDLKENLIYLYLFHNFNEVRVFDLDEELAKGYRVYALGNLFEDTLDYYVFGMTERNRQSEIRAGYFTADPDSLNYEPLLGSYQGPDDMEMASDYYTVDLVDGDLVLKLIPDKAWMRLVPTSGTEFFHISYFDFFELTFLPEENGEVNKFIISNAEGEFEFERITVQEQSEEELNPPTFWSSLWESIWKFSRTDTFVFLAVILGLILLQVILQYLRSLLS